MSSLNKIFLLGNVGKDPESRTFQDGKPMSSFSLATSTQWKDKKSGEQKSQTEWHRVVCFVPNLCNIINEHVKKGSKIFVEGSVRYREYVDKKSTAKYITEIVLNDFNSKILLLDQREKKEGEKYYDIDNNSLSKPSYFDKNKFEIDDEIPF